MPQTVTGPNSGAPAQAASTLEVGGKPTDPTTPVVNGTSSSPQSTPDGQVASTEAGQPPISDAGGKATSGADSTGDWRKWADTVDPAELLSHNRIAGIVGSMVQRLVTVQSEQTERERVAKERLEERRRLRREDPVRFAELDEAEENAAASIAESQKEADAAIFAFQSSLPEEVQAKLRGKVYPGTRQQGLQAYMNDVAILMADHLSDQKVEKFKQDWEKERLPVVQKDALSQVNGAQGAGPQVTTGGTAGSGEITQDIFDENRGVPGWIRQNKKAIHDAMVAGRITY